MHSEIKYRSDIDGLRGVAVIAVIVFHLSPEYAPGGFVGVDVFFVISGYLISRILLRDVWSGNFSFLDFYVRRIMRIIPVLILSTSFTLVASAYQLLPSQLAIIGKSAVAAMTFSLNMYLWRTIDYFVVESSENPLLHIWSLAIEEQFYAVFPLIIFIIHRYFPKRITIVLCFLAFASFGLSSIYALSYPRDAFYLPHLRFWELIVGALIALKACPWIPVPWQREGLSMLGILLILLSIITYSGKIPFPGVSAVMPCLGTALIIVVGENGGALINKVISNRPLVGIGLISYSLYIWHWPILFFYKINFSYSSKMVGIDVFFWVIIISVVAYLSWRFVEMPLRIRRGVDRSNVCTLGSIVVGGLGVMGVGLFFVLSSGWSARYSREALEVAQYHNAPQLMRRGSCFLVPFEPVSNFDMTMCLNRDVERKNVLLLGDSHAAALSYGLLHNAKHLNVLQANLAGCRPNVDTKQGGRCGEFMRTIFKTYLPHNPVDSMIIAGRWRSLEDARSLRPTIEWAKRNNVDVTIVGPVPEYRASLPWLLTKEIESRAPGLAASALKESVFSLDRELRNHSINDWNVKYVSIVDLICDGTSCRQYVGDKQTVPMLVDSHHLSNAASSMLIQTLVERATF